MKIVKYFFLSAAMLITTTMLHAQTADSIINKYIDAIGGADKLNSVTSVIIQSNNEIMGNESPATVTILNGKGFKSESEANGQKFVQCVNDKGGWVINPYMGGDGPQAMPDDMYKQAKDQMDFAGKLFNYAAKGIKVELLGQEKVGDVNAYKIKATSPNSGDITYYIDPSTYYLIKVTKEGQMMGQPVDISITFSDYRKTDYGIVMPYSTVMAYGEQFSITINVKQIDFNQPVDPSIFDMPKS